MAIRLTVEIEPDDSLPPGWLFAQVVELDIGTQLRADEDPLPVLDDLVQGYFRVLADLGRLAEVLERLSADAVTPPAELVTDYVLKRQGRIQL